MSMDVLDGACFSGFSGVRVGTTPSLVHMAKKRGVRRGFSCSMRVLEAQARTMKYPFMSKLSTQMYIEAGVGKVRRCF